MVKKLQRGTSRQEFKNQANRLVSFFEKSMSLLKNNLFSNTCFFFTFLAVFLFIFFQYLFLLLFVTQFTEKCNATQLVNATCDLAKCPGEVLLIMKEANYNLGRELDECNSKLLKLNNSYHLLSMSIVFLSLIYLILIFLRRKKVERRC